MDIYTLKAVWISTHKRLWGYLLAKGGVDIYTLKAVWISTH